MNISPQNLAGHLYARLNGVKRHEPLSMPEILQIIADNEVDEEKPPRSDAIDRKKEPR